MRADFIRPLYMAAFGGVYADLDLLPVSVELSTVSVTSSSD